MSDQCKHSKVMPFIKGIVLPPWWKIWESATYEELEWLCGDCGAVMQPQFKEKE